MMIKNNSLNITFLILSILFVGCNQSANERSWSNANNYYLNKDYNKCVVELTSILNNNNSNILVPESLFLLSEIYMNEFEEYYIGIDYLDEIINDYPDNKLSKRALFTKAYVFANYLDMYTDAINLYEKFLNLYRHDELVSSVEYELKELYKYSQKIDELLKSN